MSHFHVSTLPAERHCHSRRRGSQEVCHFRRSGSLQVWKFGQSVNARLLCRLRSRYWRQGHAVHYDSTTRHHDAYFNSVLPYHSRTISRHEHNVFHIHTHKRTQAGTKCHFFDYGTVSESAANAQIKVQMLRVFRVAIRHVPMPNDSNFAGLTHRYAVDHV